MFKDKKWLVPLVSLFLFSFASGLLIHRQTNLAIAGNTIFSGLFERKLQQYFEILLAILIFTSSTFLIWLRRHWFISVIRRISANKEVALETSSPLRLEDVLRGSVFAVLFSAAIIAVSYFSAPNRWIHSGFAAELTFYAIVLTLVYLGSYLITNSLWRSALFPVSAFFLFAHQALSIQGIPILEFGISSDSYHSGEYYIPARLLSEGLLGFFDEYNPSRGLTNYYPAFLSMLLSEVTNFERLAFYELTAVRFIFVSISFFLLRDIGVFARTAISIFLGTLFVGAIFSAIAFLLPVTWFVCKMVNFRKPIQTISILATASYVLVMHSAGEGAVWSIVVFLVLLPQILLNYKTLQDFGFYTWVPILLVVGTYFLLITYTAPNLIGYILGNGSLNTAAHAIQHSSDFQSELRWLKYGFIYLSVALFALSVFFFDQSKSSEGNFALVILGVVIVGLIRFMGRDDPGFLSRPFAGTMLACIGVFILLSTLVSSGKWIQKFGLIGACATLAINFGWFGQFSDRATDFSFLSFAGVQFDATLPDNIEENIISVNAFSEISLRNCVHLVDLTGNNSILALSSELSFIPTTSPYNAVSRYEQRAIIETLQNYIDDGGVCVRILYQNSDHDGGGLFLRSPELAEFIFTRLELIDVGDLLPITGVWLTGRADFSQRTNSTSSTEEEQQALSDYSDRFVNLMFLPATWGRALPQGFYVGAAINEDHSIPENLRRKITFAIFTRADESPEPDICELTQRSNDEMFASLTFRSEDRGLYLVPLYVRSEWYLESDISIEWNCPDLHFHGYVGRDTLFSQR